MEIHRVSAYHDVEHALRITDLKQSLYDEGKILMDKVLVTLHGDDLGLVSWALAGDWILPHCVFVGNPDLASGRPKSNFQKSGRVAYLVETHIANASCLIFMLVRRGR